MNENSFLQSEVQNFLVYEANLLDRGLFEEWVDLFDDDGIYWVPSSPSQEDMRGEVSIILEDKELLQLRVARLAHPKALAFTPPPSSVHLVGNIFASLEGEGITAKSNLIMTEFRNDRETQLSGRVTHKLRKISNGFRIQLKRVDLIQAGGTFSAITVPP